MTTTLRLLEATAGLVILAVVLADIFNGVVVPRPTPRRVSPAALLIRGSWRAWRWVGGRLGNARREHFLGIFAPSVLVAILLMWLLGEIVGTGLVIHAMTAQFTRPPTAGDAFYAAGSALETLGTGDLVPAGGLARGVFVAAAAMGLGTVALLITLLFSLYAHFQRREALVVTLDARAGSPPSGVTLLETHARLGMAHELDHTFADWERWAAEVLDNHLAYPILAYFRSSHDNESWVSALGAMLDAATLVITSIEDVPRGPAVLMAEVGNHLVEDLGHWFNLDETEDPGVERSEWEDARARLSAVGYNLGPAEPAWEKFAHIRSRYAYRLNALARFWVTPPAMWISDRSMLARRHH